VTSGAEAPDPDTLEVEAVLLASEERPSFGFPNPGLYPSKGEWDTQRAIVDETVRALERTGVDADGHVIGARNATKRIVREARRLRCGAIVMTADEPRSRFVGNFMWSQEPQRVRRRADVPVYLVTAP